MPIDLKGKSLLSLQDFRPEEILHLLQLSERLKNQKKSGVIGQSLKGKNVVLLFEKTSTRTRCAFEVAIADEGGHCTFLTNSQMGVKESPEDTAMVLGRYYDGIVYRANRHESVELFARKSGVPVCNALSELYHPTQVLADLLTIREHTDGSLKGQKLCFVGDARNNMGNSLIIGCTKMGMHFTCVAPKRLFPKQNLINDCRAVARETGSVVRTTEDIHEGVRNANIIYTDVWASLGEEDQLANRIALLKDYQINQSVMEQTQNPQCLFMHCLPAIHDQNTETGRKVHKEFQLDSMEVSDCVFRSRQSVVFDQAENRMHTAKAIMSTICGNL